MTRTLLVLAGLLGGVAPLPAQSRLQGRVDPATVAALRPAFEHARRDSVPLTALEDKALEGVAKGVPGDRIVAVVRRLGQDLRDARLLLRSAAPSAPLRDGEIVAAADAMRRRVPAAEVGALRGAVPAQTSLLVPLTVLGDLVQRGVPAHEARAVLQDLLAAGATPQQMAEIPPRVDVALRVGALPLDALRSALPVAVPLPVKPRSGPPLHPARPGP